MSEQPQPNGDSPAVDVDLDALDEKLRREAVGDPTTVRISGKVIHIDHAGDWSSAAMRAASNGDWEAWAVEVIQDKDELQVWLDANLKNYQIEAVFNECGRIARMTLGKSPKSAGSPQLTRRK